MNKPSEPQGPFKHVGPLFELAVAPLQHRSLQSEPLVLLIVLPPILILCMALSVFVILYVFLVLPVVTIFDRIKKLVVKSD